MTLSYIHTYIHTTYLKSAMLITNPVVSNTFRVKNWVGTLLLSLIVLQRLANICPFLEIPPVVSLMAPLEHSISAPQSRRAVPLSLPQMSKISKILGLRWLWNDHS